MVQYLVVVELRKVIPELCVVEMLASGFAIDRESKSEIVIVFAALEIAKLLLTARAGLKAAVPGFVATNLQIPAATILTVSGVLSRHMFGVLLVMVVKPAVAETCN